MLELQLLAQYELLRELLLSRNCAIEAAQLSLSHHQLSGEGSTSKQKKTSAFLSPYRCQGTLSAAGAAAAALSDEDTSNPQLKMLCRQVCPV